MMKRSASASRALLRCAFPAPAFAYKIFVSNEGDNTITVHRFRDAWR